MKRFFWMVITVFLLAVSVFMPVPANAADDDFSVSYEITPDLVGYLGGNVQVLLTIRNTGDTNITSLDVTINLAVPYSQRWTGTIAPGATRRLSFSVPFRSADVNVTKLLSVSMNNDSDANPDGIHTFRFQLEGTHNIFTDLHQYSPNKSTYNPGDTLTVTLSFRNNFDANAATSFSVNAALFTDDRRNTYAFPSENKGTVMPHATVQYSFTHTFTHEDAGDAEIQYVIRFKMLGLQYNLNNSLWLDVARPAPLIQFTAALSADHTHVEAGDNVDFHITVHNTGTEAIGGFEIRNASGATELSAEAMPAGGSGALDITKRMEESSGVYFVVVGRTGDDAVSVNTNTVYITVTEPETASSDSSTEPETPVESESPAASAEASVSDESTVEMTAEASAAAILEPEQETMPEASQAAEASQSQALPLLSNTVLLIIIAALLLVVIVLIILFITRKKSRQ